MEIDFSSGGGAEGTGAEFSVWDQSCECRSGLQLPSSPCPASRTPHVGEQCKQCKQCKEGPGRVVERSATPGTSSEIPLRSPTHTQQLQQHTGRCFNGAQGHDTAATNMRWIATPCLAHLSLWRFIPLAHENANFTATGTHICRMGLQNDLRDTRGANLF